MSNALEDTLRREQAKLVRQEAAVEATKALIAMIEAQLKTAKK